MSLSVRCRNAFGLNDHDTDSRESSSLSSFVFDLRKSSPSSSSSPFPAASLPKWTRARAPSGSPPARDFRESSAARSAAVAVFRAVVVRVCAPPSTSSPPLRRRRRLRAVLREDLEQIHAAHERVVVRVARGVVTHRVWVVARGHARGWKGDEPHAPQVRSSSFANGASLARVLVGSCGAPRLETTSENAREKAQSSVSTPGRAGGESADRETGKGRLIGNLTRPCDSGS